MSRAVCGAARSAAPRLAEPVVFASFKMAVEAGSSIHMVFISWIKRILRFGGVLSACAGKRKKA